MRLPRTRPLSATVLTALAVLLSGCAGGRAGGSGGSARPWEPDDALRRAHRALDTAADDGTEAEFADSGTSYIGSGLERSFPAHAGQSYRFEITCDTDGVAELTLTLSRGEEEQPYGVECRDREADHFHLPAGKPFTARVDPDEHGTGLLAWRLRTLAPGEVDGCDDDIDGCED